MRSAIVIILTLMGLVTGCREDIDTPHLADDITPHSINFREFCNLYATGMHHYIDHDVVLQGRVTSSDSCDNFPNSIFVEDHTAAIELYVDRYRTYAQYPVGLCVSLHVKGLVATHVGGVLRLGYESSINTESQSHIAPIGSPEAFDRIIERSLDVKHIEPQRRSIASLDEYVCGSLVRIDSLRLVDASSYDALIGETLADARWRGYTLFEDPYGDTIVVFTEDDATFANVAAPQQLVAICGIVTTTDNSTPYSAKYMLRMRSTSDCYVYPIE